MTTTHTPKFNDKFNGSDCIMTTIDDITYIAEKVQDRDYQLTDDDIDTMTAREYIEYEKYGHGFVGIVIRAGIDITEWGDGIELTDSAASLWGLRDNNDQYLEEVADSLLPEAIEAAWNEVPRTVTGRQAIADNACTDGMRYVLDRYMQCTGRIPSLDTPIPIRCIDNTDFWAFAVAAALTYSWMTA